MEREIILRNLYVFIIHATRINVQLSNYVTNKFQYAFIQKPCFGHGSINLTFNCSREEIGVRMATVIGHFAENS